MVRNEDEMNFIFMNQRTINESLRKMLSEKGRDLMIQAVEKE